MSLPKTIEDREHQKFKEASSGIAVGTVPCTGTDINPLAKYVEATYTNQNKTVIYSYYESPAKVTLYNTITATFERPQDADFVSAEWS